MKKQKDKVKATELDILLHKELDEFEKEENEKTHSAGVVSQFELTESLKVIKASVEEVFGPLLFIDQRTGQEIIRGPALAILLGVIQQVCPRQTQAVYNIVEHQCSCSDDEG